LVQSSAGGLPQSAEQLHTSSPAPVSQKPSPHGSAPQSIAQLVPSSLPSHVPSPQHEFPDGGTNPASQSTGQLLAFSPLFPQNPSPQHALHPGPAQRQSVEHEKQSSPFADPAQIPSPQNPPLPLKQSFGQLLQSSPASQVPSSLHTSGSQFPLAGLHDSPPGHETGSFAHPLPVSQLSVVHKSPSSQSIGSFAQPVPKSQLSAVQASLSSQSTGVLEQEPPLQVFTVHASPSSQSGSVLHCGPIKDSVLIASMRPCP